MHTRKISAEKELQHTEGVRESQARLNLKNFNRIALHARREKK
jgi:hypothetical protein